jgi:hypothetical protein
MIKRFCAAAASLFFAASPFASATSISINFEEFAYGVTVGDYYNGGQDSLGRASGAYYGVTFNGGTIKFTPRGAYLSGDIFHPISMSLNAAAIRSILHTDKYYVSFNSALGGDPDGNPMDVYYEHGAYDSVWLASNSNPNCWTTPAACSDSRYGTMYSSHTYMAGDYESVTNINFPATLYRLDNVQIHAFTGSDSWIVPPHLVGTYDTGRDIPEPASVALLGIGAIALAARRRKRNSIAQAKNKA